ncbi:MAG: CoB--CoM heterodisulfide reductase iron-sulfur subunit B family protein [Anaerolineae bacterium]|nr:CoB--CoM heterodisulfide reductase iron-sulfur subunit B family protein [Anaerolineae bacterium]
MKYSYYPGCSLERNAQSYHESIMAIAPQLGLSLAEIDDWNCCGATEVITVDKMAAFALAGRNLALAAKQFANGRVELVAPCSACYLNLRKTDKVLMETSDLSEKINTALAEGNLSYTPGSVRARHLLQVISDDLGLEQVAEIVTQPLAGLRIAPYYGCMVVRPEFSDSEDNPEYPVALDNLLAVVGAEVVDFPVKAHCCGGHMTQISEPTALEMIRRLLKNASDYQSDAIVTLCPMCQLNLDAFQQSVNRHFGTEYNIPVLYFTQVMGLAFGISPEELGFGSEFVSAKPLLKKIGKKPPKKPKAKKRKKEALPMPGTLERR